MASSSCYPLVDLSEDVISSPCLVRPPSTTSKATKSRLSSIFSSSNKDEDEDDPFDLKSASTRKQRGHRKAAVNTGLLVQIDSPPKFKLEEENLLHSSKANSNNGLTDWDILRFEAQALAGDIKSSGGEMRLDYSPVVGLESPEDFHLVSSSPENSPVKALFRGDLMSLDCSTTEPVKQVARRPKRQHQKKTKPIYIDDQLEKALANLASKENGGLKSNVLTTKEKLSLECSTPEKSKSVVKDRRESPSIDNNKKRKPLSDLAKRPQPPPTPLLKSRLPFVTPVKKRPNQKASSTPIKLPRPLATPKSAQNRPPIIKPAMGTNSSVQQKKTTPLVANKRRNAPVSMSAGQRRRSEMISKPPQQSSCLVTKQLLTSKNNIPQSPLVRQQQNFLRKRQQSLSVTCKVNPVIN